MAQVIVYNQPNGVLAIIHPNPECELTIAQIAAKDVPFGLPYKIIDASEIPEDRTWRDHWSANTAMLTSGIGADYGAGSTNAVIGYDDEGVPVLMEIANAN